MTDLLNNQQILDGLAGLPEWRRFDRALRARYQAPSFPAAIELVRAVAESAERADHHPDIDVRWRTVTFELSTHSAGGITALDLAMAGTIHSSAGQVGAVPAGVHPMRVEIAVDTLDPSRIRPFWAAALSAEPMTMPDGSVDLLPADGGPRIWFQTMASDRPGRNRLHIDVYVPHEDIDDRLRTALAAGGRMVTEEFAPSWWVLADADGNEVCLCLPDE
jgi:4a-hydroxytetrahydrobiopterin dehydratase